ncbi:sensor histidine kinase [Runella sp.]|uniref:sensor histidine kinase n=1 Tax=Runella sp. TaxID=1960881 RepID=UPI003D101F7A
MKLYLKKFRVFIFVLLLYAIDTAAQQIDLSLSLLANYPNKPYYPTDSIVLESEQNTLLITLKAQNHNPAKFLCTLTDGVAINDTFSSSGDILLKNLAGGSYTFSARQVNTQTTNTIHFTIKPLLWQKVWFLPMIYSSLLLLVAAIVYLFAMYKFRNRIRLQEIRNEIASDLHDDVGSTLSNISFLSEMAKKKFEKKPESVLPILERILEESKEMVQTMRGMVWTINPENDNAADFIDKVRAFANEMLQNREIELQFRNEIPENQPLTIEQQRNLFLVFKELVHNIAKHSGATKANITIKKHDNWLSAKITDNGCGFDSTQVSEGNGLRNLQQRIAQLEGKIEVQSTEAEGTTTKFVIPL